MTGAAHNGDEEVVPPQPGGDHLAEDAERGSMLPAEQVPTEGAPAPPRSDHWLIADLKKRHLFWVKAVFFFQSASLVTLYPYLSIHMRATGFSVEDTAVVNAVIPVADVFGPPVAGYLADKIGNFRVFMTIVTLLNGASCLLLLATPVVPRNDVLNLTLSGTPYDMSFQTVLDHRLLPQDEDRTGVTPGRDTVEAASFSSTTSGQWQQAFWFYLGSRLIIEVLRASSLMLFEGAVLVIIKAQGGDYGLQKVFGTFGALVFGPLVGKIIDWTDECYSVVFYIYCSLRLITAGLILMLSLSFKHPAKRVFKNVSRVLCHFDVMSFVAAFLCCGILWGFLETFLFWHLEDMGASKFIMGLSLAMGTLTGLPLTVFSWIILQKIGHVNLVFSALFVYALRLLAYSWIQRPEWTLLLELFKPICTSLLMISAFAFVKEKSPLATLATVEGIFGACYFGLGRGVGGLVGGFSLKHFGSRKTFTGLSIAALASAVLFWSTNRLCTRKRPTNIEERETYLEEADKTI